MAIGATIYKADIAISDIDRNYYQSHQLTIALHPSETVQRMMLRLTAFILNAHEDLKFTKGISTDDEPDIWIKDLQENIKLWIDLGQPDEKRLGKACKKADKVIVYTYNQRSAEIWYKQQSAILERFNNIKIVHLQAENIELLANRNMQLNATVQDGILYLSDQNTAIEIISSSQ